MNETAGEVGVKMTVDADLGGGVSYSYTDRGKAYIKRRERRPLSAEEPHIELKAVTDDVGVLLHLDGRDLDGLIDTLVYIQTFYRETEA